jgi:hypothetical protein
MKKGYKIPEIEQVDVIMINNNGVQVSLGIYADSDGRIFGIDKRLLNKDSRVTNPYNKVKVACVPASKEA